MEKVLHTGGKAVRLKAHAGTPFIYRNAFNSDFFGDCIKLSKSIEKLNEGDLDGDVALDILYRLLWVFAKSANKNIEPMEEWLEQFDNLAIEDFINIVSDLINGMMDRKKKQRNKKKPPMNQ